jgi:hypothetical protein
MSSAKAVSTRAKKNSPEDATTTRAGIIGARPGACER